jgi:hypothetical protein
MAQSIFPRTNITQFTIYSKKAKFIDKNVNQSMLDNHFIAANVDAVEELVVGENSDRALVRYKFLEVLARIAQDKY